MTNAERGLLRLLAYGVLGEYSAHDLRHKLKEALAAMDAEAFWTASTHVMERDKDVLQGLADYDRAARRVPRYAPTHVSKGFDAPYPTSAAGRALQAATAGACQTTGQPAQAAGDASRAAPEPSGAHYDREPSHEALKRAEQALINGWDVT